MDWANSMLVADGKFVPNFVGVPEVKRVFSDTGFGTRTLEWMFNSQYEVKTGFVWPSTESSDVIYA